VQLYAIKILAITLDVHTLPASCIRTVD